MTKDEIYFFCFIAWAWCALGATAVVFLAKPNLKWWERAGLFVIGIGLLLMFSIPMMLTGRCGVMDKPEDKAA